MRVSCSLHPPQNPTTVELQLYGRLLAYVWIDLDGDGTLDDFNLELLRKGYARATSFSHDLRREYLRAERAARDEGRGLWGMCD